MQSLTEATRVNLEQVLKNEMVLIDASIKGGSDFCWNTFKIKGYDEFNPKDIKFEIEFFQGFLNILKNPNIRIIPEVSQELERYRKIIEDHLSFYSRRHENYMNASKKRNHPGKMKTRARRYKGLSEKAELNKQLLKQLNNLGIYSQRLTNKRLLEIQNPRYELLSKMVCLISVKGKVKKDWGIRYGREARDPNRSNTDEKIISASYWQSLTTKIKPVIISSDSDLKGLLGITPRLMCSDRFSDYNQGFTISLLQRPPTLYWLNKDSPQQEVYKHTMDDLIYRYEKESIELEENQELMQELGCLWKRFSEMCN